MKRLVVAESGMVTGVGLSAAASCAAIRAAISNFAETRFMDQNGRWIVASSVTLDPPWRGRARLVKLVAPAIGECLAAVVNDIATESIPLVMGVAEPERPGRCAGLDDQLLEEVQQELGVVFHRRSTTLPRGRLSGPRGIELADQLIDEEKVPCCIVAGVDSFLAAPTLMEFDRRRRLLTAKNSDGFLPGEAGAAVLVRRPREREVEGLFCLGLGFGHEAAHVASGEPLRADGLAAAIRAAIADCGLGWDAVQYRLTDLAGEQYYFKEASLGLARVMRTLKPEFKLWHPADCIGAVGAASGPCILAVALSAGKKQWAPGPGALCHFAGDDGARAALVVRYEKAQAS